MTRERINSLPCLEKPLIKRANFPIALPANLGNLRASPQQTNAAVETFLSCATAGLVVGVVVGSFFEWTLHRFLIHRPVGHFDYAFRAHALVHHQTFRSEHTYHLIEEKDKETIPMAWWNGPVLILCCMVPVLPLAGLCFGTLLLRSKIAFPQPSGLGVPDVQPRHKSRSEPVAA